MTRLLFIVGIWFLASCAGPRVAASESVHEVLGREGIDSCLVAPIPLIPDTLDLSGVYKGDDRHLGYSHGAVFTLSLLPGGLAMTDNLIAMHRGGIRGMTVGRWARLPDGVRLSDLEGTTTSCEQEDGGERCQTYAYRQDDRFLAFERLEDEWRLAEHRVCLDDGPLTQRFQRVRPIIAPVRE